MQVKITNRYNGSSTIKNLLGNDFRKIVKQIEFNLTSDEMITRLLRRQKVKTIFYMSIYHTLKSKKTFQWF